MLRKNKNLPSSINTVIHYSIEEEHEPTVQYQYSHTPGCWERTRTYRPVSIQSYTTVLRKNKNLPSSIDIVIHYSVEEEQEPTVQYQYSPTLQCWGRTRTYCSVSIYRDSDRVWPEIGNCVALRRSIVRQKDKLCGKLCGGQFLIWNVLVECQMVFWLVF